MAGELDTVFVASFWWEKPPSMSALEWVFKNMDKNKTKIILTTHWLGSENWKKDFIAAANDIYLPRCKSEQFQAEILVPEAYKQKETVLELLTKHGMKKMVTNTRFAGDILPAFADNPNSSCKIWFIDVASSKLDTISQFGPNPDVQEARAEVEKFKKIADEETTKRKNTEEKSAILIQENEQLKKTAVLNTYITSQELVQATQNFSDSLKIGEGGSGSVYKGTFRGTTVAIKKFKSENKQVLSKFEEEIIILSTVRHPNLVTLMGTCSEPPTLIYEFLTNGSLQNYLTLKGMPLMWKARTSIISEICLALIFLHSNKPNPIVHGDLKPANIFLDINGTCKLSDFGLVKQANMDNNNLFQTTDPEKTFAYMDPAYLKTGKMTIESDVYSLGVIILRLITGKSPLGIRETVEESMGNNKFSTMIDQAAGKWPLHHAEEMANIGIKCAQDSPAKRPHLANEVWPIIEGLLEISRS